MQRQLDKLNAANWIADDEQENAEAQFQLGKRYYSEKIYPGAVKCFRQAAEQGHAEAQYNLGVCYANGCGVPKDLQPAIYWYTKAAEQGNEDAQKALTK